MRPTFQDFLDNTELARTHRARTKKGGEDVAAKKGKLDLSGIDFAVIAQRIIDDAIRKATETAVDERERLIATYLHAHPAETRVNAVNAVYTATPGLYERCRKEETVDTHGQTLAEGYRRVQVFGVDAQGRPISKGGRVHSADEEVHLKIGMVLQKSGAALTYEQAMNVMFENQPELYQRWKRESQA